MSLLPPKPCRKPQCLAAALITLLFVSTACPAVPPEALATPAWPDEPNELCWEHFAACLHCFDDFAGWAADNGEAVQKAGGSAAEAGLSPGLPQAFDTLRVEAESFPLRGTVWSVVEAQQQGGQPVSGTGLLRGRYGHNASVVRQTLDVPEAGPYRLWVRYWHLQGYHASFRVRVLPPQMLDYEFGWQTTAQGEWLNHRFDFAEHGRKQPVLSGKDEPTGFVWECAPLAQLPSGALCLELAGCIHSGPYTYRQVDCLVLTSDPLWRPGALDDAQVNRPELTPPSSTRAPHAETVKRWDLWCVRPGAVPPERAPDAVRTLWRDWRKDLLARLANGDTPSRHLQRLARRHCFDADWNLIGTPAQIVSEIERLRGLDRREQSWYEIIEAESMTETVPGWTAEENSLSGGGKRLRAHYCDGLAEMSSVLTTPHDGRYRLWVHHSRIKGYTNLFQLRVASAGDKTKGAKPEVFRFGEEPSDAGGYRMIWSSRELELRSGDHRVVLSKNRGKGPYAYRHVDRIILTDDSAWQPEGLREPPLGAAEIRAWLGAGADSATARLAIWRPADIWRGFDLSTTRPGSEDEVMPQVLALQAGTGEVISALLHVANPSAQPVTVTPRLAGSAAHALSWRVVAYVLSKPFGWQPLPLLRRPQVTVPPLCTASLWLTADARQLPAGEHEALLDIGTQSIKVKLSIEPLDVARQDVPLVGGWTQPYAFPDAWRTFADVGINVIHGAMIPKAEMDELGIRLLNVTLGTPADAERVRHVVRTTQAMGLSYNDWSWEVFDEPSDKSAAKWAAGAQAVRAADPRVRIWCNPGDMNVSHTEAVRTMAPYVDVFCPFINHFARWPDDEHAKLVAGTGRIKLFYTTPCASEKAPHAPLDMLHLGRQARRLERDGWDFFCLKNYYEYCNTPWDDLWAYHRDQAVSIYPGAGRRVLSTRNLEALREAVRRWRRGVAALVELR